jgi:hypothetical protein
MLGDTVAVELSIQGTFLGASRSERQLDGRVDDVSESDGVPRGDEMKRRRGGGSSGPRAGWGGENPMVVRPDPSIHDRRR